MAENEQKTVQLGFMLPEETNYLYGVLSLDRDFINQLFDLRSCIRVMKRGFATMTISRVTLRMSDRFSFSDNLCLDVVDDRAPDIDQLDGPWSLATDYIDSGDVAVLPDDCEPDCHDDWDDEYSVVLCVDENDMLLEIASVNCAAPLFESPNIEWDVIEDALSQLCRAESSSPAPVESPARPERRVIELQEDL